MAVKLRMQRCGAKHAPVYRLVAADSRKPRDGKFVEILGTYSPKSKRPEEELLIKLDRIDYWLGVGAQPSDTARSLINRARRGAYEPKEADSSDLKEQPVAEKAPAPTEAESAAVAEPEAPESAS